LSQGIGEWDHSTPSQDEKFSYRQIYTRFDKNFPERRTCFLQPGHTEMTWKEMLIVFVVLLSGAVLGIDIGSNIVGKWLIDNFPNTILYGFGLWLVDLSRSITIAIAVTAMLTLVFIAIYVYIKTRSPKQSSEYYDYYYH
jgi:hypothetical protein